MTIKKREIITCLHDHNDCPYLGRPVRMASTVGRPLKKFKGIDQLLLFFATHGGPITKAEIKANFSCRTPELLAHIETLISAGEIRQVEQRIHVRGPAAGVYEYIGGKKDGKQ